MRRRTLAGAALFLSAALGFAVWHEGSGAEDGTLESAQRSVDESDALEHPEETALRSSTSERVEVAPEPGPEGAEPEPGAGGGGGVEGCRQEKETERLRDCLLTAFSSQSLEQAAQALAEIVCHETQRGPFQMECIYACMRSFPPDQDGDLIRLTAGSCPDQRSVSRIALAIASIAEFDPQRVDDAFASGDPGRYFGGSPGAVDVRILGTVAEVKREDHQIQILRRGAAGVYGGSEEDMDMALMMSHALCADAEDKLLFAREILLSQDLVERDGYVMGTTLMDMLVRETTTKGVASAAVEAEVIAAIGHPTLGRGAASQLLYTYTNEKTPQWTTEERWADIRAYAESIAR